ncbi:fumarylacetoacetate hydrolase family protein [Flavobacterium selenitireducens]|uniref:fumarylacetoacetate hydrolase family protein n=1 Tax=Flavobacterium selenitireducens TaxID=2722704 RepID=UPI00168B641C|nr:fumarylacetoacetate hydrolase family protein [Flavobacterium selenitireducens]MBD3580992.1 fumarylacetoacetate hydrolase family protein [Flavobacterium selenitireducens]
MKLATYTTNGSGQKVGVVQGDVILDLETLGFKLNITFPKSILDIIDGGSAELKKIEDAIKQSSENTIASSSLPKDEITLLAPIPRPRKNIIGIGLNYTEHVAESARTLDTDNALPQKPVIFSKPPTTVTATNTDIIHNENLTKQLDWEVELAVIIGKKAKYISRENAMDYVFGYTVINDISARDCRRAGQWIVSKGQDTFAPMGPFLVTKDEIDNPHDLQLSLQVNGVEKQNSNTKFMLFDIPALIADLSEVFTLEPGDIIATGTPAGVGAGRDPQEWMWDGDVVEATVEKIGTLVNTVRKLVRD